MANPTCNRGWTPVYTGLAGSTYAWDSSTFAAKSRNTSTKQSEQTTTATNGDIDRSPTWRTIFTEVKDWYTANGYSQNGTDVPSNRKGLKMVYTADERWFDSSTDFDLPIRATVTLTIPAALDLVGSDRVNFQAAFAAFMSELASNANDLAPYLLRGIVDPKETGFLPRE